MPIYDISKTYLENANEGPFFFGKIPPFEKGIRKTNFLGFEINSPIGVPAGPLLNAKWIALAAALGFDVPTYKTIRSFAYPGHPLPNVLFVERMAQNKAKSVEAPPEGGFPTITNSFGMPSMSPEFLMQDIANANASLTSGQVMIVSVVGTPNRGVSLVDDYVRAAGVAKAAGAKIIEANFSCPNVEKEGGCLYMSADVVAEFGKKIAAAIRPIPLLIKVGDFRGVEEMRSVFVAAARSGVAGIAGLNSVSMEVIPQLDPARKTSGVCGSAIREDALRFMREAAAIKRKEKLDLALVGCGGIVSPEHFREMLEAGADIAGSATGMMWDPLLAIRYREMYAHR
jgi:dihydroorotate dehydrogenase